MRVLFLHVGAPRRSRDLAVALAAARHQVVFATHGPAEPLPRVQHVRWSASRPGGEHCHRYLRDLEQAVLAGQGVVRLAHELAARGFRPDLVYGEGGSGVTLYVKETFPEAKLVCSFARFHRADASDASDAAEPSPPPGDGAAADAACLLRARNGAALLDLAHCDHGVVSSEWHLARFPPDALAVLSLLHDGVDDTWFRPAPGRRPHVGPAGGALTGGLAADEVVTVACARLATTGGVEAIAAALANLQRRRPMCQLVVVGGDVGRNSTAPAVGAWAAAGVDVTRLRVVGPLEAAARRDLLQASAAYVHLGPVEDNMGLLEAMSSGCLVVAPDLGPARELVAHGEDGLLFPVGAQAGGQAGGPATLGATVADALADGEKRALLGKAARETVLDRFRRADLAARQLRLVDGVARGVPSASVEGSVAHRLGTAPTSDAVPLPHGEG